MDINSILSPFSDTIQVLVFLMVDTTTYSRCWLLQSYCLRGVGGKDGSWVLEGTHLPILFIFLLGCLLRNILLRLVRLVTLLLDSQPVPLGLYY